MWGPQVRLLSIVTTDTLGNVGEEELMGGRGVKGTGAGEGGAQGGREGE